ncbi:hypothetical protein RsTz2092_04150 [Deferribacterales bacterium RsTz2092]|nr:hypothetical protein AGMMS49941_08300 [Deferribacterales bacterium]
MASFAFDIPANINAEYPEAYWSDRVLYSNVIKNSAIDRLVKNLGLVIEHDEATTPVLKRNKTIVLPPKGCFPNASNYYHAVLHEATHHMSRRLGQDDDLFNAITNYSVETNQLPNLSMLVSCFDDYKMQFCEQDEFKQLGVNPDTALSVAAFYMKEEVKCETVALAMLQRASLHPDENDISYAEGSIATAMRICRLADLSIDKDTAGYNRLNQDITGIIEHLQKEFEIAKKQIPFSTAKKTATGRR